MSIFKGFLRTLGVGLAILGFVSGISANDRFAWLGNSPLDMPAASGLLANAPVGATIADAEQNTTGGGEVEVRDDGRFQYTPAFGFRGLDTFTITITGDAAPTLVSIRIDALAWFVDNTADQDGNGSLDAPFNSLAAAQAASAPGDTVFVFQGEGADTGLDTGFDFKDNQRLVGQGVAWTFDPLVGVTVEIQPADVAPVITDAINTTGIMRLANNNEVAGVTVDGTLSAGGAGFVGNQVAGFNLHDLTIVNSRGSGVALANVSANGSIINTTISNNLSGDGVSLAANGANANFILSGNSLSDLAGYGFRILFDGTAVGGDVTINANTLSGLGVPAGRARGIDMEMRGIADVVADISNNTIDMAGAGNQSGIAVRSNNTSMVTLTAAANSISGTSAFGGIDVEANDSGTVWASLLDNSLVGNQAFGADIQAGGITSLAGAGFPLLCLNMARNSSDTGLRMNNIRAADDFQFQAGSQVAFQAANPGINGFTYLPSPANFVFAPAGCGAP